MGIKTADSFNHTLHKKQEYKINSTPTKSSIDNLIRGAKKQADSVVLQIESGISLGDLRDAITDRLVRAENITDITIYPRRERCYIQKGADAEAYIQNTTGRLQLKSSRGGVRTLTGNKPLQNYYFPSNHQRKTPKNHTSPPCRAVY